MNAENIPVVRFRKKMEPADYRQMSIELYFILARAAFAATNRMREFIPETGKFISWGNLHTKKVFLSKVFSFKLSSTGIQQKAWVCVYNKIMSTISCILKVPPPYNRSDFQKTLQIARTASFGRTILL